MTVVLKHNRNFNVIFECTFLTRFEWIGEQGKHSHIRWSGWSVMSLTSCDHWPLQLLEHSILYTASLRFGAAQLLYYYHCKLPIILKYCSLLLGTYNAQKNASIIYLGLLRIFYLRLLLLELLCLLVGWKSGTRHWTVFPQAPWPYFPSSNCYVKLFANKVSYGTM